jgi:hypothetical protein
MPQLEVVNAEVVVINADLIRREAAAMCGFAAVQAMIPGRTEMEWTNEPPKGNMMSINNYEVDGELGWLDVSWGSMDRVLVRSITPAHKVFGDTGRYTNVRDIDSRAARPAEQPIANIFMLVGGRDFNTAEQKVVREIYHPDREDWEHGISSVLPLLLAD